MPPRFCPDFAAGGANRNEPPRANSPPLPCPSTQHKCRPTTTPSSRPSPPSPNPLQSHRRISPCTMSRAPPSPSFRPPANARRGNLHLALASLAISPPTTTLSITPPEPPKDEISPVVPLDAEVALAKPEPNHQGGLLDTLRISPVPRRRRSSSCADNDIYALDDAGWSRVANSEGIEAMLKLGEGVSGSVTKCRLRKSGQIFAIKVLPPQASPLWIVVNGRLLRPRVRHPNTYSGN